MERPLKAFADLPQNSSNDEEEFTGIAELKETEEEVSAVEEPEKKFEGP